MIETPERTSAPPNLHTSQLPARAAPPDELEDVMLSVAPVFTFITMLALLLCGGVAVALLRPDWLAAWINSIVAPEQKMFWYLTRASGFVALALLWLSMILGLTITNKLARAWPGGPTLNDLHEYASLLGLAFTALHALVLLGDQYTTYSLVQVLVPFASSNYRPLWVGLGQLSLYASLIVTISFYMRRWIGYRTWRTLHYLSFGVFVLAIAHSLFSGSDSTAVWARDLYWGAAVSVMGLVAYRMVLARSRGSAAPKPGLPLG
jgi:predicted ferric reductase